MPTHERRSEHRRNGRARDACYHAIRECIVEGMRAFYGENPDRLDARSIEAVADHLKRLYAILDGFEIGRSGEP